MRKIVLMALSAALAAVVLPMSAWAASPADADDLNAGSEAVLQEVHSGTCGENATWTLDMSTGALTISGTGAMSGYYGNVPWLDYRSSIKSVVINPGITSIGDCDFQSCASLESVSMPSTVTRIGFQSFMACTSLRSVDIPEGVSTIGISAFMGCTSLTSVSVPSTVTHVYSYAFSGMPSGSVITCATQSVADLFISSASNYNYQSSKTTVRVASNSPFSDVTDTSAWYYSSVMRAASKGLIEGYDNGTFGPGNTLTRAQAATILWRYYDPTAAAAYDATTAKDTTGMADMADGQYYTGAANWAVSEGVINGFDNADGSKSFSPDGVITREQLCAIVANASASLGSGGDEADMSKLSSMPDAGSVDTWATDSVAWALTNGVISGKESGGQRVVDPLGSVTRAEMAAITMNSIDGSLL